METVLSALTRWFVVLALMLACWPFSRHVRADEAVGIHNTLYSALFKWNGAKYRFTIGTIAESSGQSGIMISRSRFAAVVAPTSGDLKSQASCERLSPAEEPLDVNSMSFSCQGAMFGPMASIVRFSFPRQLDGAPKLTIDDGKRVQVAMLAND